MGYSYLRVLIAFLLLLDLAVGDAVSSFEAVSFEDIQKLEDPEQPLTIALFCLGSSRAPCTAAVDDVLKPASMLVSQVKFYEVELLTHDQAHSIPYIHQDVRAQKIGPLVMVFKWGRVSHYYGPQRQVMNTQKTEGVVDGEKRVPLTTNEVLNFVNQVEGAVMDVASAADLQTLRELNGGYLPVFLGAFDDADSAPARAFRKAAFWRTQEEEVNGMGMVTDPSLQKELGLAPNSANTFVALKYKSKYEADFAAFSPAARGEWSGEAVEAFMLRSQLPLVGEYTVGTRARYSIPLQPLPLVKVLFQYDLEHDGKVAAYWLTRVRRVAQHFVPHLKFAVGPPSMVHNSLNQRLRAGDLRKVAVFIEKPGDNVYSPTLYEMHDEFSQDALQTFCQKYVDGKLYPVGEDYVDTYEDLSSQSHGGEL